MEDNSQNNRTTSYKVVGFSNNDSNKGKNSFSKSVLIPFFSGVIGTSLVIATCFGIPQVRERIIGNTSIQTTANTSRK